MKIKMLSILAGIVMAYSSLAQSDSLVITDSTAWNQLFAPLIPLSSTGIIPQTTISDIPWERLTGNLQLEIETVAPALFNQVLTTLNDANLGQSYTAYSMARDNFKSAVASGAVVPIVLLDLIYDEFRHDDTNLIRYDTLSQSLVLNDLNQDSLFYTESLFIAAVPDSFYADGLSLVLDSNHYYSNKGAKPDNFQLSFDDGQTWDTYNWGSTIPLGVGNTEIIHLKANYGGAIVKSSKFKLNTFSCANSSVPSPELAPWNSNPNQFENGNITSSYSQSFNLPAVGNAYTWFRDNTLPGEENLYKKPIVIVEGIDFGDHNTQNASNFQMGDFGWCALWGNNPGYPLQKMPTMLNDLHAEGYDIIMLDFKDGDYYIQDNAFLLATLLEKINNYKTADAEPTVVLGASMGGIVARYALRWMEMNNKPACARMLMTLDSPHQGAYVPLGVMRFIDFFANNELEQNASAQDFDKQLQSPAARQLLLMDKSGAPHPWHLSLYNELAQMGYPKTTVNVAIASGAKNGGDQGFAAGAKLFEMSGTSNTTIHLGYTQKQFANAKIWSLKDFQSNQVFDGKIGGTIRIYALGLLPFLVPITKMVEETSAQRMGPSNVPSFDRVAGGQRPNIDQLDDAKFPGWLTTNPIHASQSFIPLKSALDIQNSNWYYNAENLRENYPDPTLTPFNAIYAAPRNTFHVEISDGALVNGSNRGDNIEFALRYIKNGGSEVGVNYNLLTNTYNYGVNSRSQVLHKTIGNGGQLLLYANQADGGGNLPAPPVGETHVYSYGAGGCSNEVLTVANGGVLNVGDATANNKAIFNIRNAATLKIENGGSLQVADNSKLIIQDGANLIFENGASIDLQGPNAELVIQGKLTLGANTTFTHTGNGKIIFDQQVYKDDGTGTMHLAFGDYMEIGTNAKLDLSGPAGTPPFTQKLVEVRKPVYFIDGNNNTFEEVDIRYGAVDLAPGALMYFYSKTDFHSVTVNSTGGGKHGGIRIWNGNGAGAVFSNCNFSNGQFGVMADWLGGGPAIQIRNSHFTNNTTGISVNGGNFQITNNQFNNNGRGVGGSALAGTSTLGNCQVIAGNNGWLGIGLSSQNGALVNITATTIKDYSAGSGRGIEMVGVDARVTCSDIRNNNLGINIWDGILYIDEDAGNEFINNNVGISYDGSSNETGIYLLEGQNKFSLGTNGSWYISGRTQGGGLLTNYLNSTTVNADFNEMPMQYSSATSWTFPVRFGVNINSNALGLSVQNNFQNNTGCNNPVLELEHPMLTPIAMESGVGGDGPFFIGNFKTGLRNAIANITFNENELDDLAAYVDLMDLLEATFTNRDASYQTLRHMAIGASMSALENSFQYEHLIHAEGGAVLTEVQRFIDILNNELDSLSDIDSNDHQAIFRYTLNKTQVYRVAGNYTEAMALFGNYTNWTFNNTQSMRAQYWQCICDAEKQLYDEIIGIEDFGYLTEQCDLNFAGFNYKRAEEVAEGFGIPVEVVLSNVSLYPQPVNEKLTVNFSGGFSGASDYTILNTNGQLVVRDKINWKGSSAEQVNLSALTPGLYFITLDFGELGRKTYKITKE